LSLNSDVELRKIVYFFLVFKVEIDHSASIVVTGNVINVFNNLKTLGNKSGLQRLILLIVLFCSLLLSSKYWFHKITFDFTRSKFSISVE